MVSGTNLTAVTGRAFSAFKATAVVGVERTVSYANVK